MEGTEGVAVLFDEYPHGQRDAIFIFIDTSRDYFTMAYGWVFEPAFPSGTVTFDMFPPIKVSLKTFVVNAVRYNGSR